MEAIYLEVHYDSFHMQYIGISGYDIDEQIVERTSVNYLTNYIYDVAQIPKPGYNKLLEELQGSIPVMSTNAVYSQSEKRNVERTELSGIEAKLIRQYNYLVYNAVYDVDARCRMFVGVEYICNKKNNHT